jgi:UDP-2,3-diacylglucosamine pyrophosphatase LpxH
MSSDLKSASTSGTAAVDVRGAIEARAERVSSRMHVRTIWISDFHLGTRHAKADELLDFLRRYRAETMYLVGDVFDGWSLARNWYWKQSHNDVVQKILRSGRKGTRVIYIPGNHDEFARAYSGLRFGNILVENRAYHTLVDGRRLLIVHGDEFDGVIRHARWLQLLGAAAYGIALNVNHLYNLVRKMLGKPYWSLSAWLKNRTKKAVQYVAQFEQLVAEKARNEEVDGVVCGHIHRAEASVIDGVQYLNCGDWVESCTALVEHFDGRLEIVRYTELLEADAGAERARLRPRETVAQETVARGDGYAGVKPEMFA